MDAIIGFINDLLWGTILIYLLLCLSTENM